MSSRRASKRAGRIESWSRSLIHLSRQMLERLNAKEAVLDRLGALVQRDQAADRSLLGSVSICTFVIEMGRQLYSSDVLVVLVRKSLNTSRIAERYDLKARFAINWFGPLANR